MITRQRIVTVLTTTAIAYSICSPVQAASFASIAQAKFREPIANDFDRDLQDDVKTALGNALALDVSDVVVASHDGQITLSGTVRDAIQLARALQTTLTVSGVRRIDNALAVRDAQEPGDVQAVVRQDQRTL